MYNIEMSEYEKFQELNKDKAAATQLLYSTQYKK